MGAKREETFKQDIREGKEKCIYSLRKEHSDREGKKYRGLEVGVRLEYVQ